MVVIGGEVTKTCLEWPEGPIQIVYHGQTDKDWPVYSIVEHDDSNQVLTMKLMIPIAVAMLRVRTLLVPLPNSQMLRLSNVVSLWIESAGTLLLLELHEDKLEMIRLNLHDQQRRTLAKCPINPYMRDATLASNGQGDLFLTFRSEESPELAIKIQRMGEELQDLPLPQHVRGLQLARDGNKLILLANHNGSRIIYDLEMLTAPVSGFSVKGLETLVGAEEVPQIIRLPNQHILVRSTKREKDCQDQYWSRKGKRPTYTFDEVSPMFVDQERYFYWGLARGQDDDDAWLCLMQTSPLKKVRPAEETEW
jgi:hypothetical protein